MRLKELSDHDLRAEFSRNRGNLTRLEEISEVLRSRNSDEAIELHMELVGLLRKLRKASGSTVPSMSANGWIAAFLLRRGLQTPDGRPLHQYRMTDREYADLRESLRQSTTRLLREDGTAASMFVAFCAEWFRRDATTLFLKWESVAAEVLHALPYRAKTSLAEIGLKYWKRPLIRSEGGREFLLTLALEGGISAHLLADSGSTWLSDYLRTVMRFALTSANREHVRGFAHDMSWRMPISYRQDGFVNLCCELILELVKWRKTVDLGPSNIDPVRYLDAHSPDWKESLPIYMSTEHGAIARKLLGGLLNEKIGVISTTGITAERYLCHDGHGWQPALLLNAEGEISAGKLPGIPQAGRWKASPSGTLANFLPSQVALFEPPVEGAHSWRVRPLVSLGKLIVGFHLNDGATVNLTCGSEAVPVAWPGGAPISSPIATFTPDEGADPSKPNKLKLAKTGSASLPAPLLYVLVPNDWDAMPAEGTARGQTWSMPEERTLHAVSGTVYFSKPGASPGERYRIEAGKDDRQESLDLSSATSTSIHTDDDLELYESSVMVRIGSNGDARQPQKGELLYKRPGEAWRSLSDGSVSDHGVFDISWRDPMADIQLERRRIVILPSRARIQGQMTGTGEGVLTYESLQGWNIDLPENIQTIERADGRLRFAFNGRPAYRIPVRLRTPSGHTFNVTVTLRSREASIILGDGRVVSAGEEIDVTALRGAIAASPHHTTLTLMPRTSRSNSLQFKFSGEFPLSALKRVVEEFMAPIADQDAVFELEFLGDSRKPICLKQYRYPRPAAIQGSIIFGSDFTETPVARMILNPDKEHLLRPTVEGAYEIPDWCNGPCLVYLRDGPDVVSRPLLVHLPLYQPPKSPLLSALVQQDFQSLRKELAGAVRLLEAGELPAEDIRFLVKLVSSLNGLPASAFEVLKEVAQHPLAILRLLLAAATDAERQAIWGLQEQLPFLWLAIPPQTWEAAFVAERDTLDAALSSLPDEMRQQLLIEHFRTMQGSILTLEPGLDRVFVKSGFPATAMPTLDQILQSFVQDQRMFDDDSPASSIRRDPLLEQLMSAGIKLPNEFQKFSVAEFEGMVAPVALAAAAHGMLSINRSSEVVLRKTLREHSRYVSFAYAHLVRHFEVTH